MPKKKGAKDKSHLGLYWRKGWRYIHQSGFKRVIFPRFDEKKGCFMDDA